jgi:hypothetical protein
MLALGDDLVDRACSRFVHERPIRQAVARRPDGFATVRVTLRDDTQPILDEPTPEEGELDFLVVTFMGLLGLNLQSALKLNPVLTALPNQCKGVVLSMPTVLLREFAHHVSQNEHLSDCVHIASLLLEQLSDLKARLGKGEVSKDAYVIDALRFVTDDFGVASRAITPEFITELYSSRGAFGADAASEHVHGLSHWFSRAESCAEESGRGMSSVLGDFMSKATSAPRPTCECALWAPFPRRCLHCVGILSRGRHESQLAPAGFVLESETKAGGGRPWAGAVWPGS